MKERERRMNKAKRYRDKVKTYQECAMGKPADCENCIGCKDRDYSKGENWQ